MEPTNYVEYQGPLPWRRYYFMFDHRTSPKLAELFAKEGVRPKFYKGAWVGDGEDFGILRCNVLKSQAGRFEDCLEKRMRLAMLTGEDGYVEYGRMFAKVVETAMAMQEGMDAPQDG